MNTPPHAPGTIAAIAAGLGSLTMGFSHEEERKSALPLIQNVMTFGGHSEKLVAGGARTEGPDNPQFIVNGSDIWKNTLVPATHPDHTPTTGRDASGL